MPNLKVTVSFSSPDSFETFHFDVIGECGGFIELPAAVYKSCYKSLSKSFPMVAFGEMITGRIIAVVYEELDEDTVYPVTAYEVDS